ncbi:MAG: alanine racemase [Clostridia bacterium]|nr:alanine racemase [Clostridia bacterium]
MEKIYNSLRTWAEVDLDVLKNNHRAVCSTLPEGVKCAVVIKADAYGHGARRVAHLLQGTADYFAVAMTDEALELRHDGIDTPILVLAHSPADNVRDLAEHNIETTVSSIDEAADIAARAAREKLTVGVHIALDTGMSRIGFACTDKSVAEIEAISDMVGIEIKGIFSHFAAADSEDLTFTREQTEKFTKMVAALEKRGVKLPLRHVCNSAAAVGDGPKFDMVREGILLYGLAPAGETDLSKVPSIAPAMALRTHVSCLRRLAAGVPVSYGCTFVTERESVIATIQAGYADGVPRALSNKGYVLIRGKKAPIAGRVCMDQMMVDVTDIPEAEPGAVATIFGADGDEVITADGIASLTGTIGYEIICGINKRVPRVYKSEGSAPEVSRVLTIG